MPLPASTLFPGDTIFPADEGVSPYEKSGTLTAGASTSAVDSFTAVETGSVRTSARVSGVDASSGIPPTPPAGIIPALQIEIDFLGNPTATYADIQANQDDTVSFWRMNSTSTSLDERLANTGTIIGTPTTTASPYTYDSDLALQFDGSADGAYVPSSTGLISKGNFTIAGWLRVDSLPGATRDIVSKRGGWMLQLTAAGKLVWTLKDDNSTATVTSNTTLVVGTWYHVAAVYDSVNISIWIN